MIKLLIFDLDGTLADTARDITNALNYALEPYGIKKYSVEETKLMVGSGISKLLESLIPPQPTPEEHTIAKETVINRFLHYYDNHLTENTVLYPKIKETLPLLDGFIKVVLSNKREKYSREILEKLGIAEHFDLVWGSDSVREKKPSPVPILDLLDRYRVAKHEAVIVGDSNYDVDAGRAAGVKVIAVTYGFRPVEYLRDADVIIDRFDALIDALKKL